MIRIYNATTIALADVPLLKMEEFGSAVITATLRGARLASFFGVVQGGGGVKLFAVLAWDQAGDLSIASVNAADSYPSLTPDCPQAHWFEREIFEQTGVVPEGHPWLKPIRSPLDRGADDYVHVEGKEAHEVAVGPIHAGVIEPGHFRFQCHGEDVLHLEIALGYQHRGIEMALVHGPDARTLHLMETLAGDTTIGHSYAYCQAIEAQWGCQAPARADALRGIALELERMANHVGDLGAMAQDVGYQPTASMCGRLRGSFLNITSMLCGSRFGRSLLRPGGVGFDVDSDTIERMCGQLNVACDDVADAVNLLWDSPSVLARFEDTGVISADLCREQGLVGPVARASGLERDVRFDYPTGIYRYTHLPVSTWSTGDVFARAYVRWLEVQRSKEFIETLLGQLRENDSVRMKAKPLAPESIVVSLVEGWRGEICHCAITDERGRFSAYKVVDPSFHNWAAMTLAMRGEAISEFPICNKSMNLSYCGHDL